MNNTNIDKLRRDINLFASNKLTRMYSRLQAPLFGTGDTRKHKYRISILNSLADLYASMEEFEANILGSSGDSIFVSFQHLENSNRILKKISSTLSSYVNQAEKEEIIDPIVDINNDILDIIRDFNLNKFNFNSVDDSKFKDLESLIDQYISGNSSVAKDIINKYNELIFSLSGDSNLSSLEDVLKKKDGLEAQASLSNFIKKWYGTAAHHMSIFDATSPIRLDLAKKTKEALKYIDTMLNSVEKDLDQFELFEQISELSSILSDISSDLKPLLEMIKGSSFGKKFLSMIDKDKLTDFPANISDKDRKSFESYLKTREFKDLLDRYSVKDTK